MTFPQHAGNFLDFLGQQAMLVCASLFSIDFAHAQVMPPGPPPGAGG